MFWEYYLYILCVWVAGLAGLYAGIICPIVFHFSIVPRIEKRIGEKLEFKKFYNAAPFPLDRLTQIFEVGMCIAVEYLFHFFGKTTKHMKTFKNMALTNANLNISDFPRREIIWSLSYLISTVLCFSIGIFMLFLGWLLNTPT